MVHNGMAVSKGVAVGKIFVYRPFSVTVRETSIPRELLEENMSRYRRAIANVDAELSRIRARLEESDPDKAAIIKAHLEILHDEVMAEEIADRIEKDLRSPDWAVEKTYLEAIALFDDIDDPLIRERAADLKDVRNRILRNWHNVPECSLADLTEEVIVVAYDLMPSDAATLDRAKTLAIVTEIGGATSHTAIIAKSYNIPALVGVSGLMEAVLNGQEAAVDALGGVLIVNPSETDKARLEEKRRLHLQRVGITERFLNKEPKTLDGLRVEMGLNIGSGGDADLPALKNADCVGLFRTEFLYMEGSGLPDEEEQFAVYKKVLAHCNPRSVTIRTLDAGGDKQIPGLDLPHEDNPFLGNRALRLCFSRPEVFRVQLRALLRASVFGNLWLMLPMVGSIDDIRRARAAIAEVKRELDGEGAPYARDLKIGIMIEIPSIAVMADIAVREVDFASIGTNDLCQYLTAVDRLNPVVARYYQSCHPAVFRMIGDIARAFNGAGKPLSVCGEMAGDPLAAPVLVGLGLRKLSMGPNALAPVKYALSRLSLRELEQIARTVREFATAAEVEEFLKTKIDAQ